MQSLSFVTMTPRRMPMLQEPSMRRAVERREEDAELANNPKQEISRVLQQQKSSEEVERELFPLVYEQLRDLARRRLSAERPDHTLQATALVHEAYLRLLGDQQAQRDGHSAFFLAASEAMRRILVDYARKRQSLKRGGNRRPLSLDMAELPEDADPEQMLALDDALTILAREDARAAEVIRLRFFAGMNVEETTKILGVSERTVMREWAFARARLFQLMGGDGAPEK